MKLARYSIPFPAYLIPWSVLIYFNWIGTGMKDLRDTPWIQVTVTVASVAFVLLLLQYRPTFAAGAAADVAPFVYAGQGYVESAAIGVVGWLVNLAHFSPWFKFALFAVSVPLIHSLLEKRVNVQVPNTSRYPDIGRP